MEYEGTVTPVGPGDKVDNPNASLTPEGSSSGSSSSNSTEFSGIKSIKVKTNGGPIPVATLDYVDHIATGGSVDLTEYITEETANERFAKKEDIPAMSDYLPLAAGTNNVLTGPLYTNASTPYLIGTSGKAGLRANKKDGSVYAAQVAMSYISGVDTDPYFINMVANANSENQTSLRLGVQDDGSYGLTYKKGDQTYKIYHEGNLDLSDISTEGFVSSAAGDFTINNTTSGISLTSGTEAGFAVKEAEAQIWGNDTLCFIVKPTGAYITDVDGSGEYQIVDESMILTATEVADILNA